MLWHLWANHIDITLWREYLHYPNYVSSPELCVKPQIMCQAPSVPSLTKTNQDQPKAKSQKPKAKPRPNPSINTTTTKPSKLWGSLSYPTLVIAQVSEAKMGFIESTTLHRHLRCCISHYNKNLLWLVFFLCCASAFFFSP